MTPTPDRRRQDLTRAVDQILWAWPHATIDAESLGFRCRSDDGGMSAGGHADPTSAAALSGDDQASRAIQWIHDWAQLVTDIAAVFELQTPAWTPAAVRSWFGWVLRYPVKPRLAERVYRQADLGLAWWPPAPAVRKPGRPLAVGADDDGMCARCGLPCPSGRDFETGHLLARTIDGRRYHNTAKAGEHAACWWQQKREDQRQGVSA